MGASGSLRSPTRWRGSKSGRPTGAFEEVPAAELRESLWHVVRGGVWRHREDIMVLEARAVVKAVERLSACAPSADRRCLFLADNMSLVLSLERGRSTSFPVLVRLRKVVACALCRGIAPRFRWIPSELNSADAPSRGAEAGGGNPRAPAVQTGSGGAVAGAGGAARCRSGGAGSSPARAEAG